MPSSSASARLRSMASAAGLLLVLSAVLGGAAVLPRKPRCMHSAYLGTVADLEAGKPLGEPLSAAPVGARIVHRWHCDGDGECGAEGGSRFSLISIVRLEDTEIILEGLD